MYCKCALIKQGQSIISWQVKDSLGKTCFLVRPFVQEQRFIIINDVELLESDNLPSSVLSVGARCSRVGRSRTEKLLRP